MADGQEGERLLILLDIEKILAVPKQAPAVRADRASGGARNKEKKVPGRSQANLAAGAPQESAERRAIAPRKNGLSTKS